MRAQLRDRRPQPHGGEHLLERPAVGDVIMHIIGGHERQTSFPGDAQELLETLTVLRSTMQLGHGIAAVAEHIAVVAQGARGIQEDTGQQSGSEFRNVGEAAETFPLGSTAAAAA